MRLLKIPEVRRCGHTDTPDLLVKHAIRYRAIATGAHVFIVLGVREDVVSNIVFPEEGGNLQSEAFWTGSRV